jgi:hypothetical protein
MRSVISVVLSITLLIGFINPVPVYADEYIRDIEFYADCLKILGLMQGTDKGYEPDRSPTRAESAVMLVRLLGKEKTALEEQYTHPFTDVPGWAAPYIGFLYREGLTKGIGENRFGSVLLTTPLQYAAFLLRALGYSEEEGDFSYFNALKKLESVGVLNRTEREAFEKSESFTRKELILLSYRALWSRMKDEKSRLADRLVSTGAVNELCILALGEGLLPDIKTVNGTYYVQSKEQLDKLILRALYRYTETLVINPSEYSGNIREDVSESLKTNDSYTGMYKGADFRWLEDREGNIIRYEIHIKYTVSPEERKELLKKACRIVADLVKPGMTDVEKELAVHDYLVLNTSYGYSEHCYDAYGALIEKEAVCQGYSRAMLLLLSLAGVYCREVVGTDQGTSHSWNMVRLDGEYYHVDATYDDPVGAKSVLRHYYFNVTDKDLEKYRLWDRSAYPVCDQDRYNYYNLNGTYLQNRTEMLEHMKNAFAKGERSFSYRLKDYNPNDFTSEGMKALIRELSEKINGNIVSYSWAPYDRMGVVHITLQ